MRIWIAGVGAATAYVENGSPWENGYVESLSARLRDKLLNGEVFHTVVEAHVLIERSQRHYNVQPPRPSLGCHPPAPEVMPFQSSSSSTTAGMNASAGRFH